MSRTTVTFTISLPPEMEAELRAVMKEEYRTRSELIREALRQYFADRLRQDLDDFIRIYKEECGEGSQKLLSTRGRE